MQGQRVSPSASHAVTANVRLTYIVKIARVDGDDPELPGQAYGAVRRRRIRGGVQGVRTARLEAAGDPRCRRLACRPRRAPQQPAGSPERRSRGSVFDPDQPAMANLL